MKHRQLMKRRLMLRPVLINILIGCFTVLSVLTASGQNVTISPSSGSLIAGVTASGEVGFENGSSSLWRHNQLPLTLHVSDYGTLTESGVLKEPAGDIRLDDVLNQNLYLIHGGSTVTTHLNISLPKGYRFTGYRMVLLNNMNGRTVAGQYRTGMNKRMYETNSSFEYNNALASTPMMGSTNSNQEFVIERTSKTTTDMGNNLYFYFWRQYDKFYACTIKSIELYFTAEAEFQAEGVPGTPSEIISEGVNMVGSSFTTGKLDLGTIQPNTKSGETYYSYNYLNVIDLTAQNWLYQKDAVTAGKLPATGQRHLLYRDTHRDQEPERQDHPLGLSHHGRANQCPLWHAGQRIYHHLRWKDGYHILYDWIRMANNLLPSDGRHLGHQSGSMDTYKDQQAAEWPVLSGCSEIHSEWKRQLYCQRNN